MHAGCTPPGGFLAIFLIMWKMAIIEFTKVELENARFKPKQVWERTLRRLIVRVNARAFAVEQTAARLTARDDPSTKPPNALNKRLYPIATVDHWGRITWSKSMIKLFTDMKLIKPRTECPSGPSPPPAPTQSGGRTINFVRATT